MSRDPKATLRAYLYQRFPAFRRAKAAFQYVRRCDSTAERFIGLYANTKSTKPLGRCTPLTLQIFIEAGLWEAQLGRMTGIGYKLGWCRREFRRYDDRSD